MTNTETGILHDLTIDELNIHFAGKPYQITHQKVEEAFEKAKLGDFAGPNHRYFLRIDNDMKSTVAIFSEIVPIDKNQVSVDDAERIAGIFKTLGYKVLDAEAHHKKM